MPPTNYKKILFFSLLSLIGLINATKLNAQRIPPLRNVRGQGELMTREVDTTGKISLFGPNRLFFISVFSHLGAIPVPQVYGAQTNWWSGSLSYGMRMKLKIFSWNALVMDANYRYDRYSIRQKTPKLAPLGTTVHVRERISLHNFSVSFCDRINFRKRGNVLGTWLDFGVYGDYVMRSTNVFVDRYYDSNSPTGYSHKSKTTIARLPYIERMNYGITIRAGGEFTSFFAQWRMNDLFNYDSPNNRDMPKLIIGIGFAGWE